ncbi:MAG: hypothetical protein DRJ47_06075 [Thermoprotei archaeon]|nr:MAG: hypothetical protein DRJ47_06075 [Thermoprotei archaeon]
MTVRQLIRLLENIKDELKDKEIYVISENRMLFEPCVKYKTVEPFLSLTKENVEYLVLTYE